MTGSTTRLAPSPTGALHLGNLRTFLVNWVLARQNGWKVVLRIDDLDGPRIKANAAREAIDILKWTGLDWDEGPVYQSNCLDEYRRHLTRLAAAGSIYPCQCTRKQIAAACLSAPHADQHELRYPGTCRPAHDETFDFGQHSQQGVAWRFRVADRDVRFVDQIAGAQSWNVQQHVGDFLVSNKQAVASYQLACVVDDALAAVTDVVRGDDLIASTPRQMLLAEVLDLPGVRYWHLPLVVGADGRRLAKRHGDTTIASYRKSGVSASRIRGLIAYWCGSGDLAERSIDELQGILEIGKIPQQTVVFSAADDAWLLKRAMKSPD